MPQAHRYHGATTSLGATDHSGSITSGAVAQTIIAENQNRKYLFIHNISDENMWINFGTTATTDQPSIRLQPDYAWCMQGSAVFGDAVSIIGATTGKKFTAKSA